LDAGKVPERIAGVISANVRLRFGFEQLLLVVTDRRIVVVHKGKKGAVGLASILVLGSHSGSFLDPDKPGSPLQGRLNFEKVDVEKILASNKNNFDVRYEEMISVEVDEGPNATSVTMVTGNDKFQFFTGLEAEEVVKLLAGRLGDRLSARKTRS
jgi:hypothetical protein